jgi:hypothetical protein
MEMLKSIKRPLASPEPPPPPAHPNTHTHTHIEIPTVVSKNLTQLIHIAKTTIYPFPREEIDLLLTGKKFPPTVRGAPWHMVPIRLSIVWFRIPI